MSLRQEKMKVVILGCDSNIIQIVNILKRKKYSICIVSISCELDKINGIQQIDEDCLFENLNDFDFAIRCRNVGAANPNIILLREMLFVYNSLGFLFEQLNRKIVFVIGGSVVVTSLMRYLDGCGFHSSKWEECNDSWLLADEPSGHPIVVVQIFPEDLVDMHFISKIILIDSFSEGDERGAIENYIRLQCLFSQMRGRELSIICEYNDATRSLKSEFSTNISLFSVREYKADFFIDNINLIDTQNGSTSLISSFSEKIASPCSPKNLIQLYALSHMTPFRKWLEVLEGE